MRCDWFMAAAVILLAGCGGDAAAERMKVEADYRAAVERVSQAEKQLRDIDVRYEDMRQSKMKRLEFEHDPIKRGEIERDMQQRLEKRNADLANAQDELRRAQTEADIMKARLGP